MLKKVLPIGLMWVLLACMSCSQMTDDTPDAGQSNTGGFQINGALDPNESPAEANFRILEVFDGRGSLEEIWDSIDGTTFNDHLEDTVDIYPDAFVRTSESSSTLMGAPSQPLANLLGRDLDTSVTMLMDTTRGFRTGPNGIDAFYVRDPEEYYTKGFYSILDELWAGDYRPGDKEIIEIAEKFLARSLDKKSLAQIRDDVQDLVDDLTGERFDPNFKLIAEVLGKSLLQTDYPVWTDAGGNCLRRWDIVPAVHTNTGVGNAVRGTNDLAAWVNRMLLDPESRGLLYTAIRESVKIFDPDPASPNAMKLRTLLTNLEDHFTVGGAVYETNPLYKSTETDPTYTDTELGQTLRELLPHLTQLLMRSDRPTSLVADAPGESPVYLLRETVAALNNLGYNPDDPGLETSIYNMLRYDLLGRDRTDPAAGAYPASFLDSLVFLTNVAANFGWKTGGITGESSDTSDPTYNHGHGTFDGVLTINDSLISMTTTKTIFPVGTTTVELGIYDITMKGETDGDPGHVFRSRQAFDTGDRENYRFDFTPDYGVLGAMPGVCAGEVGTPQGGNPDGTPPARNSYAPFNPTGHGESNLGAWSVGWAARAGFGGEGPYYYADPSADIVSVDGKNYYKYLRPDGRVYALVNKDNAAWEYIYPTENGDAEDPDTPVTTYNGKHQRFNRYQYEWHSDYLMTYFEERNNIGEVVENGDRFRTVDNSGDKLTLVNLDPGDPAGRLTYHELIPEDSGLRACRSSEEALYRNFQWVSTEKKMVIILPMYFKVLGGGSGEGTSFMVLECNGFSGLANLRKFTANHVWVKNGTDGTSDIPGDYRIELAAEITGIATGLISETSIYNDTIGTGHGTPSIVGRNMPALYRLAFPLSPLKDHSAVQDYTLGSGEITVGDAVWQQRNAVLPPFLALAYSILRHTPSYETYDGDSLHCGLKGFVNGLAALQKPLIYYEKNGAGTMAPFDCWKLRVQGDQRYNNWTGDFALQPAVGLPGAAAWNGSAEEQLYYQPAPLKTLINLLTDSDITIPADQGKRMDGVLPLVLTRTRTLSALIKALMSGANDSDQVYSALEQIVGAVKYTRGAMTAINAAPGATKPIPFPAWMFATGTGSGTFGEFTGFTGVREEDIILNKILDTLIGHDSLPAREGYGLADYVDTQTAENWVDFDRTADALEDFLYPSSPYSMVESLIAASDAIFARKTPYTEKQIAGLVYGLGKLFTYFDTTQNRWVIQGDPGFDNLYTLLNSRIPAMHNIVGDDTGINYGALFTIGEDMLRQDGMADFLVDAMSTDDGAETVIADLHAFLADDIVNDPAPLWSTLSRLMADLARAVDQSKGRAAIKTVYNKYDIQIND